MARAVISWIPEGAVLENDYVLFLGFLRVKWLEQLHDESWIDLRMNRV